MMHCIITGGISFQYVAMSFRDHIGLSKYTYKITLFHLIVCKGNINSKSQNTKT